MSRGQEFIIERGGERYVLQSTEDSLRVGRLHQDDISWLDLEISLATLDPEARQAVRDGDAASPALAIALSGIEAALANRGG